MSNSGPRATPTRNTQALTFLEHFRQGEYRLVRRERAVVHIHMWPNVYLHAERGVSRRASEGCCSVEDPTDASRLIRRRRISSWQCLRDLFNSRGGRRNRLEVQAWEILLQLVNERSNFGVRFWLLVEVDPHREVLEPVGWKFKDESIASACVYIEQQWRTISKLHQQPSRRPRPYL